MTPTTMKSTQSSRRSTGPRDTAEPVGIVISRGREAEQPPRFSAYMYAPVPDEQDPAALLATA